MTSIGPEHSDDGPLLVWLGARAPARLLALGTLARSAAEQHAASTGGCEVSALPLPDDGLASTLAAVSQLGRFDVALITGIAQAYDHAEGGPLVARLRDLHAPCVVLADEPDRGPGHWTDDDFRALGFTRLTDHDLLVFDIDSYKRTPDWLSARHWANPELWDKHRW